jgi:hypothetical protein
MLAGGSHRALRKRMLGKLIKSMTCLRLGDGESEGS